MLPFVRGLFRLRWLLGRRGGKGAFSNGSRCFLFVGSGFVEGFASSSVLSAIRFLVPPPAGYFPAMESNQRSPGLRARTPRRGEIRSIPFPAKAENCIALLCPSFSPPDPLRWAPAGAPTRGAAVEVRGLQALWLLPAV